MKLLSFAVVLTIVTNAVWLGANAAVTDCGVSPLSNVSSLPTECQDSATVVANAIADIAQPNFTDIGSKLGNFCQPDCVEPIVNYYECLGEIDLANIFDGFVCGRAFGDNFCLQLWSDVYNLSDTDPDKIDENFVKLNCNNPLMCNESCSKELNKAVANLGCCLAGIVQFNLCGAFEKVRFEECSIQIPAICQGVANTPTTPAPVIPTAGTNCVHPVNDANYPTECESNLKQVENFAITLSAGDFKNLALPANTSAVLNSFCTLECLGPLVDYYSCTGEPDFANAINSFICGRNDTEYCLATLPSKFAQGPGSLFGTSLKILQQCNDVLVCSSDCSAALNTAKTSLGCCLAGLVEFTVCGAFEQIRFDECGVEVGSACPGVDLTKRTESPSTEPPTMATTESGSGGVVIVSFSLTLGLTLLSIQGIVSLVITKLV